MSSRLVLVRHAKSDYPWGVNDHDRPLNDRGRRDASEIGSWLDAHITWDDAAPLVLVSTARRAQLTWNLAAQRLAPRWGQAVVVDEERIYEASVRTLQTVVAEAGRQSETVVLVGHNPGLVGLLEVVAVDDARRDEAMAKFPTSSVAVLEGLLPLAEAAHGEGTLHVTAFVIPRG